MKKIVHTITLPEALEEYKQNSDFRDALSSGQFVYVKNYYVLHSAEYVRHNEDESPKLTNGASENIKECALAFETFRESALEALLGEPKRGAGSKDAKEKAKAEREKKFVKSSEYKVLVEKAKSMRSKFDKTCRETYQQRLWSILEERGENAETFKKRTNLDRSHYDDAKKFSLNSDYYKAKEPKPVVRTISAIAAGYNLDLDFTEELLKLAGHAFDPTDWDHQMYKFVIVSMCGNSIEEKNQILRKAEATEF